MNKEVTLRSIQTVELSIFGAEHGGEAEQMAVQYLKDEMNITNPSIREMYVRERHHPVDQHTVMIIFG